MSRLDKSKSFTQRALGSASPRTSSVVSPRALVAGSPRGADVGTLRGLSIGSPKVIGPVNAGGSRLSGISRWFQVLIVIGSLVSFVVIAGGYAYMFPSLKQAIQGFGDPVFNGSAGSCNVFDGTWVYDGSYPWYSGSECPFVEQGFNCLGNGREDDNYLKWRWKPRNCYLPNFDVGSLLEMLRGKKIVFVGDSMSRTQWESLVCLLWSGVENKTSVYEFNGSKITKRIRHLVAHFETFNFTIEFYRSVFLVQRGWMPRNAPKRVRSTLKLDKLDELSHEWVDSDVLIFNSGQWWVPGKLFDTGCYFQVDNSIKLGMSIPTAYRIAIETWASWVEGAIDTNRTRVFFRTFEPSHWSGKSPRTCNLTKDPTYETEGRDKSIFTDTILEVIKGMKVPVTVLHVSQMSASRSDAHVGNWSDNPSTSDCSHWCLPGLPDMWNKILLSHMVVDYRLLL